MHPMPWLDFLLLMIAMIIVESIAILILLPVMYTLTCYRMDTRSGEWAEGWPLVKYHFYPYRVWWEAFQELVNKLKKEE